MFEDGLENYIKQYYESGCDCMLLLKKVPDPERYGVAVINDGVLVKAVEKPLEPISDLCITGIYMYDSSVFNRISKLKPSSRGEYEITEVNNSYIKDMSVSFCVMDGWWTDAGTHESYRKANLLVSEGNV